MASITSVNFTAELRLNDTTPQLVLTDTTDYGAQSIMPADDPNGIITANGPAGMFYNNTNFGAPDLPDPLTTTTNSITIPLPLDGNGNLLKGNYSVTYTVRVTDLTQASLTSPVKNINYEKPTASVVMSVDLGAPLLTTDDQTGYTIDTIQPTITRDHDLFYPASFNRPSVQGTAKVVTTNVILVTPGQTVAYTSTLAATTSYDYGDGITLTDLVNGQGQLDIVGNQNICQVYCCLNAAFDRYIAESRSNSRRAIEVREQWEQATAAAVNLDYAIRCGKTTDANEIIQEIRRVLDCDDDCDCGDEPQLVVGMSSAAGSVTVVAGSGITVTSTMGGGTTEYTVSMDAALLSKLNVLRNAIVVAGTNVTVTSVTVGDEITYTVNADSQIQNAAAVLIAAIAGVTGANVQEALESLKALIDAIVAGDIDVTPIAGVAGTTVQAVLEGLKALIDALTAGDIAVTPIAGLAGTDVQTVLQSLDTAVDTNTTNITTNTGNITTNTTNISTNTTSISTINTTLSNLVPPSWTVVDTFTNDWGSGTIGDLLPFQYRNDPFGNLVFSGAIVNSGTPGSDDIFTLPAESRPSSDVVIMAIDTSGGTSDLFGLQIDASNGTVSLVVNTVQANMVLHVNASVRRV